MDLKKQALSLTMPVGAEGKPPLQSARQPQHQQQQQQQQLPWFSLIAPALMQANQAAGQLPVPASSLPQASNGAAMQPLSGSLGAAAPADPLSAWYTFHFGQQPSFGAGGIGPIAAQYSMQLAGKEAGSLHVQGLALQFCSEHCWWT